jgi:hypothetical protein
MVAPFVHMHHPASAATLLPGRSTKLPVACSSAPTGEWRMPSRICQYQCNNPYHPRHRPLSLLCVNINATILIILVIVPSPCYVSISMQQSSSSSSSSPLPVMCQYQCNNPHHPRHRPLSLLCLKLHRALSPKPIQDCLISILLLIVSSSHSHASKIVFRSLCQTPPINHNALRSCSFSARLVSCSTRDPAPPLGNGAPARCAIMASITSNSSSAGTPLEQCLPSKERRSDGRRWLHELPASDSSMTFCRATASHGYEKLPLTFSTITTNILEGYDL